VSAVHGAAISYKRLYTVQETNRTHTVAQTCICPNITLPDDDAHPDRVTRSAPQHSHI
jgi:hypothetical protein